MAIDPQLEKVVDYLVEAEAALAEGVLTPGRRPWVDYVDIKEVGKFDYAGVHELFTRKAANDEYVGKKASVGGDEIQQVSSSGVKSKDLQTAKLSADYLSGLERDFRMRQRTPIRCFIHAASRHAANGTEIGPLRKNSIDWLSRILAEEDKS